MEGLNKKQLEKLTVFRKKLHKHAELSDQETMTADIITDWFASLHPDQIIEHMGGYGLSFVYKGQKPGNTVLLRCELDALPIHETTEAATVNHDKACDIIKHCTTKLGYSLKHLDAPLRVSEDFGEFTASYPGAIFGIGSGKTHSQLHNSDFDFPDKLITIGCNMFMNIINQGVQL